MTLYLGIDPGVSGAWTLLRSDGTIFAHSAFDSWRDFNTYILPFRKDIRLCCLEKVHGLKGEGAVSTWTFAKNYGGWLALLEVTKIPHELVPPQRWQRMFLGSFPPGQSKQRSVEFVSRKFPNLKLEKKDHGISDSVLLACYALALDMRRTRKLQPSKRRASQYASCPNFTELHNAKNRSSRR